MLYVYFSYIGYMIILLTFSRITRNLKQAGNADKIVVVVGTVTNDLRYVGCIFTLLQRPT